MTAARTGPAKAVLAAAVAVLGALVTAAADGQVVLAEWLTAALAGVVAFGGVYRINNKEKP